MTPDLATSFLSNLVEQTAICLYTDKEREFTERSVAARGQFEALTRAHQSLHATIAAIGSALAKLAAAGDGQPSTDGLSHALEGFRAQRGGANVSWLNLYCATAGTIESINLRSTRVLDRLSDDQRGMVLVFAQEALAFLEVSFNRDFEVAGMTVTCDRLVEQGIISAPDRFRVAKLQQSVGAAAREVAESGARWSATFEATAAQLEHQFVSRRPVQGRGAFADWLRGLRGANPPDRIRSWMAQR